MQRHRVLCTSEYTPDHGGVARYLHGLVKTSTQPVEVVRVDRSARWYQVLRTLWRATAEPQSVASILCSHVVPIGTACYLLSLLRAIPYEVYFHGMDIALIAQQSRSWRRWLVRRIVRRAAAVYANSHYTAEMVHRVTGYAKVQVKYPTIAPLPECDESRVQIRDEVGFATTDTVLLSVARLVYRKGVDRVLRAIAVLEPSVKLVVIGDGPERKTLEQLAATLGIADRVRVLGAVEDAATYRWYHAADLFVMPPRMLGPDVEGFGMVYLEAGWYGLPVIATRTGGIPDAVVDGETGLLIDDSDDPVVLANSIQRLNDDPALRAQLGAQARSRVRQYFVWNEPNNRS